MTQITQITQLEDHSDHSDDSAGGCIQIIQMLKRSCARSFVRLSVRLIFRSFVCSFVRLLIRSLVCFFVCPFSCFFHLLALDIDANIARHSRKEVVNHIKKHPRQDPKVLKMVSQRGPGPSFWVPRRPWTTLLGLLGSHVAPQCPPGRFLEDFGAHFWSHFEPKINEIRC